MDLPAARVVVTELLKQEGFGILTEIDVAATLKAKIGAEVEPYLILGACNPRFAHQALLAEEPVGILLPCNVALKQVRPGLTRVWLTRVPGLFSLVDNDAMGPVAGQVGGVMEKVIEELRRTAQA
ncbi:DUF302 domain-containing protein [Myxococcota bacterium]|nr:DUF302 domain-containing protein [Myxococcota bacterium]